jgi:hypothetical protein
LDITGVYSIEYSFTGYHGNDDIVGETMDKEEISKIIMYFNSLSRPEVFIKNKGATVWIGFKDKNGNLIAGYAYGTTILGRRYG